MVLEPDKSFSFAGFAQLSISPSGAFTQFTRNEIEQSIPSRFEQIVDRWPSRIAVKVRDQTLTYDMLNKLSNRIAHALRSFSCASKEPIALLVKNDLETVAAILGIAKAGKIYVPLDVSFSPSWAKFILKDTGTKIVLTGKDGLSLAKRWVNSRQNLIGINSLTSGGSDTNPGLEISPGAVSQILYTSGTTGTPKGVMDIHRNMLHYVMRLGNPSHISIEDRITLVRPPSSAGALSNLYLALLSGAAILPVDLREVSLAAMVGWLQREKITVFHASGTVFRHFAQQLTGAEEFPDLRLIRLGSGLVYRNDVELFKRHFPEAVLLHVLSSTETNTYRLQFIGKDSQISEDVLPVGYAVQDMDVLILDDCGNRVGTNEVGEIAVRSDFIFPGYWNNSALTAAAFVNDPEEISRKIFCTGDIGLLRSDGCLQYLGRKDFQVKIRGYRIQTEEVESALLQLAGLRQAAVTAHKNGVGDDQLVAYISFGTANRLTVSALRDKLRQTLPEFMVPSKFVILDNLPLNPNGKIDRQNLPLTHLNQPGVVSRSSPATPVEVALAKIWSNALGISNIGIDDPFFEVGGDSITASKIVSIIGRIFPWHITLAEFYDACTVAKMANLLLQKAATVELVQRVATLYLQVDSMSSDEVERMVIDERRRRQHRERLSNVRKD